MAHDYTKIITVEPGKPCIRGLRITVYDGLEYLASGMSEEEILSDLPDLELSARPPHDGAGQGATLCRTARYTAKPAGDVNA